MVAIIPINEETAELIAKVYIQLRAPHFDEGSYLIFLGGDARRRLTAAHGYS